MNTYLIGMNFVGWLIVILMGIGILAIKRCEEIANNPDEDDTARLNAEAIVNDYNSKNFGGKLRFLFQLTINLFK